MSKPTRVPIASILNNPSAEQQLSVQGHDSNAAPPAFPHGASPTQLGHSSGTFRSSHTATSSGSTETTTGSTPRLSPCSTPHRPEDSSRRQKRKHDEFGSPSSVVQSLPSIATIAQSSRPISSFTGPSCAQQGVIPTERSCRRELRPKSPGHGLSSNASPNTSNSSYSQKIPPVTQHAAPPLAPVPSAQSATRDSSIRGPPAVSSGPGRFGMECQRPAGIPISSSGGQNIYQIMTLETTSGTVQLPVDVQAASRVADEKRRRNASASARFRERRKMKEKTASTTIARLEQQVKECGEDAEFYRRERDVFQGILSTIPGCERHLQRPPSPRHRRSSNLSYAGSSGLSHARPPPMQDQTQRNIGRRDSTVPLPRPHPPASYPPLGPINTEDHSWSSVHSSHGWHSLYLPRHILY